MADAVTIVVPVRDEERTVGAALESLAVQTLGPERIELLVFDGGSTDRTAAVCRAFADRAPWRRFAVVPNPARTVPHALNAGLAEAGGRWFGRVDGRVTLSPDYLEACLDALAGAERPAAAGGRFAAHAEGRVPAAIAAAVTHPLGVGPGFRTRRTAGTIPHHPFALWATADVRALGGFAAELTRNQDDEFSMRAARAGARILLVPGAVVTYRPRERLAGLAAQYFQYGLWKSAVARQRGLFPPRSLAPAGMLVGAAGGVCLAVTGRTARPVEALAAAYLAAGGLACRHQPGAGALTTGCSLAATHAAYGAGVVAGAVRPSVAGTRLGTGRVR